MTTSCLIRKKNRRSSCDEKNKKKSGSSTSSVQNDAGSVTPSNKSERIDDLSSLSSSEKRRKDRSSCLNVLQAIQKLVAKAVYYHIYRLKNKSRLCPSKIASKVARLVKKPRPSLEELYFDNFDTISILDPLKDFRDVCGSIFTSEGAATCPGF